MSVPYYSLPDDERAKLIEQFLDKRRELMLMRQDMLLAMALKEYSPQECCPKRFPLENSS